MKYLLFLAIKSQGKKARGFTLIELLVVQGYRYEKGTFATLSELALEAATISLKFYNISEVGTTNPVGVAYELDALTPFDNDIKNYAGAAGQTAAGAYTGIVCEDETPLEDNVSTSNSAGELDCVDGIKIN